MTHRGHFPGSRIFVRSAGPRLSRSPWAGCETSQTFPASSLARIVSEPNPIRRASSPVGKPIVYPEKMRRSGSPSSRTATTYGLSDFGIARYSRMPTVPINCWMYLWLSDGMRALDSAAIKESDESSGVVIAAKNKQRVGHHGRWPPHRIAERRRFRA